MGCRYHAHGCNHVYLVRTHNNDGVEEKTNHIVNRTNGNAAVDCEQDLTLSRLKGYIKILEPLRETTIQSRA